MITKNEVDPRYIIDLVCDYFDVTECQLLGRRREAPVVKARHVAMYLIGIYTQRTLVEIGRLLNGRKPETVSHAFSTIGTGMLIDGKLARDVAALKEAIKNG